jgi:hypothetical protein
MERCDRRAELLKLKLTDCYEVWCEDVDRLLEIVSDVEWDRVEQIASNSEESEDWDEEYSDYYSY